MSGTQSFRVYLFKRGDKKFSNLEPDVFLNKKDLLGVEIGNILQVKKVLRETTTQFYAKYTEEGNDVSLLKDRRIYIEKDLADTFAIAQNDDVNVEIVDSDKLINIILDSVELTVRERFMSRSDMWIYRRCLINNCIFTGSKPEWLGVPTAVSDLWLKGDKVQSGFITQDTRIVFRSSSLRVFICIQISSEMWKPDLYGEWYFEKCLSGFLPELFTKWQENSCAHYVTIVVASRWYFGDVHLCQNASEFSRDCRGRLYKDFYRVVVQNEHYNDWMHIISKLRVVFMNHRHHPPNEAKLHLGAESSREEFANLSTATDGNFLEQLNVMMNSFNVYYKDRRFETLGQQIIFVTAGDAVYNVDRRLVDYTKQRSIDMGISFDIVCLGEQPLHIVPLFIFESKTSDGEVFEDYLIPHWMNYSYYRMPVPSSIACEFRPRIRVDLDLIKNTEFGLTMETDEFPVEDMDAYDERAFASLLIGTTSPMQFRTSKPKKSSKTHVSTNVQEAPKKENWVDEMISDIRKRSEAAQKDASTSTKRHSLPSTVGGSSGAIKSTTSSVNEVEVVRSLINPFRPEEFGVRITANRRRWIHVFPVDRLGRAKLCHYYVSGESMVHITKQEDAESVSQVQLPSSSVTSPQRNRASSTGSKEKNRATGVGTNAGLATGAGRGTGGKRSVWVWGSTDEERWNPSLEIGVDWKSLVRSGILPITTDFFPDERSIQKDYLVTTHQVVIDNNLMSDWTADKGRGSEDAVARYRCAVFDQLVCQRLQRGFQIVRLEKQMIHAAIGLSKDQSEAITKSKTVRECFLSFSHAYHRLYMDGDQISVTQYFFRPNEYDEEFVQSLQSRTYKYYFEVPDGPRYVESTTSFKAINLVKLNWSYLDTHLLYRHVPDIYTNEYKCFSARFLLTPSCSQLTKKVVLERTGGDSYAGIWNETLNAKQEEGFVRLLETICGYSRKPAAGTSKKRSVEANASVSPRKCEIYKKCDRMTVLKAFREKCSMLCCQAHQNSPNPPEIFLSVDLIAWLIENVEDIRCRDDAIEFGTWALRDGRIRPLQMPTTKVEGERGRTRSTDVFCYGFYLYYFVIKGLTPAYNCPVMQCLITTETREEFLNEFLSFCDSHSSKPIQPTAEATTAHQNAIDLDFPVRQVDSMGRPSFPSHIPPYMEGGRLLYNKEFRANQAYEFVLKWYMAAGQTVVDVVRTWCNRANTAGFHLFPVPEDPFALPNNPKSSPLRSPVSIHLDIADLVPNFLWQVIFVIVYAFGFVEVDCHVHPKIQFVHISGGMFLSYDKSQKCFLWAWNYMLSHRYCSHTGCSEQFQDYLLSDFRDFCDNKDNRLVDAIEVVKTQCEQKLH